MTKDYKDFLKRYENHKEKNSARSHLFRKEGFEEMNEKYENNYNYHEKVEEENKEKFNVYRERYTEAYWDTKENHAYYS